MSLFLLFLGKYSKNNLELYQQKLLAGAYTENNQIFNGDFYLPSSRTSLYKRDKGMRAGRVKRLLTTSKKISKTRGILVDFPGYTLAFHREKK